MSLLTDHRRPLGPVLTDPHHEFLAVWLAPDDPVLTSWVRWFRASRVKHVIITHAMTINGITGTYAMLYTHRLLLPRRGGGSAHWCCHDRD